MRKIFLFMMASLDGYMEGPDHDLSWHNVDDEFNAFAIKQLDEAGALIFGRRTYELMAGFWPKYKRKPGDSNAVVADKMDELPKIVFSKSLDSVAWSEKWDNISLLKNVKDIAELKKQPGKDLAVLGSNNLCVSLLRSGLLDELRIMVNPVVIGAGTPLFEGLGRKQEFKLMKTRVFNSGNVLLYYRS